MGLRNRYFLVDAFTSHADPAILGNPAGVVITSEPLSDAEASALAIRLQVPALAVLSDADLFSDPSKPPAGTIPISWLKTDGEFIPLCGHATLAASVLLFSLFPADKLREISYRTRLNVTLKVTRKDTPAGVVAAEMCFPALPHWRELESTTPDVAIHAIRQGIANGGLDATDSVRRTVEVAHVGGNHRDILVEVAPSVDLGSLEIDSAVYADEMPYRGIWFISPAPEGPFDICVRAFFPYKGHYEDQVCGHAHTMFVPYFASTRQESHASHEDGLYYVRSKQVSANGGVLEVRWDGKWGGEEEGAGNCYIGGEGKVQDLGSLDI